MKIKSSLTRIIVTIILAFSLSGCDTLSAFQANPKVQFAETLAMQIASSYFNNNGNIDAGWAISQGLNAIGTAASFSSAQKEKNPQAASAAIVTQTVKDFAGNPKMVTAFSGRLGSIVAQTKPKTADETAKVALGIASGVQKALAAFTAP